jgi:RNA-directed DNA polymerase
VVVDLLSWVEATVWNKRMLTALETGVQGGNWFSLIDKVYALPNLRAAFARVQANAGAAGVDRQTIEMFEAHLEAMASDRAAGARRRGAASSLCSRRLTAGWWTPIS